MPVAPTRFERANVLDDLIARAGERRPRAVDRLRCQLDRPGGHDDIDWALALLQQGPDVVEAVAHVVHAHLERHPAVA